MPDRLLSLIVLVGFWVPPALAGWLAASSLERRAPRDPTTVTYAALSLFVVCYAVAWYYFNLHRMPPYIPGVTMDPTFASPRAARALAIFTSALILPGSALACALAFWRRRRVTGSGIGQPQRSS
jgi:biotin transporter BioY